MLFIAGLMLSGCSSSTPELTETQRQNQILDNPMGYKPDIGREIPAVTRPVLIQRASIRI